MSLRDVGSLLEHVTSKSITCDELALLPSERVMEAWPDERSAMVALGDTGGEWRLISLVSAGVSAASGRRSHIRQHIPHPTAHPASRRMRWTW